MNENELTLELHRVADAVPVPEDLYSLTRRPQSHNRNRTRSRWLAAAAAAAALAVFLVTPLGARAVRAAGQFVMQYTVEVLKTDKEHDPVISPSTRFMQPGETLVSQEPGRPKFVETCFLLKDLAEEVPLPTYRGPGPDARVVREEMYKSGSDLLESTSISIDWQNQGRTLHYWRIKRDLTARELKKLQSGKADPVTIVTYGEAITVETKEVVLKGQPATAHKISETWTLVWRHEKGGGSISGNVELDELLKIAESLPDLK